MLAAPAVVSPVDRSACPAPAGKHGTRHHRYKNGCVCPDGLADLNRYSNAFRAGEVVSSLVDAVGTRRRMQALATLGYGAHFLADYLTTSAPHVQRIRGGRVSTVQKHMHDMVVVAYERLHGTVRESPGATRAILQAQRRGWVGPDQWLDDELDDPAALPDSAYRRPDGAAVATADLLWLRTPAGGALTLPALAQRTGLSVDAVERRLLRAGNNGGGIRRALTDEQVYAIRDEYRATRDSTWSGKAVAGRYGVARSVISEIIRGSTRPELALTDLTAHPRGTSTHSATASPAGRATNRKENAA